MSPQWLAATHPIPAPSSAMSATAASCRGWSAYLVRLSMVMTHCFVGADGSFRRLLVGRRSE